MKNFSPNKEGFYGEFGGAFVPEMLYPNIKELQEKYLQIITESDFQKEFQNLLRDYVGRPTPLFFSSNLSKKYKAQIYLKREDLNHTGAHKINNTIGQILVAKKLNKKRIIAETGDLRNYEHAKQVIKMSGLSLKENSSGKKKGKKH